VAQLNAENFGGYHDWRIPNVKELQSIVDYGKSGPSVAAAFNTNCATYETVTTQSCTQSDYYWSATTYAGGTGKAWLVDFDFGYVNSTHKTGNYYVRAVRSGL
jgi:hypothetical protein